MPSVDRAASGKLQLFQRSELVVVLFASLGYFCLGTLSSNQPPSLRDFRSSLVANW